MKDYLNTINGKAVGSDKTFESINPATGESIGRVPVSSQQQVKDAITAALSRKFPLGVPHLDGQTCSSYCRDP